MSAVYNSNLSELMKAMHLSSRNLSEMLNVHYSLVSKWLNGKRPLKQNSDYMKQIVEIMLNLDQRNRYSVIKRILSDYYPTKDINSRESMAIYLSHYLATDEYPEVSISSWDVVDRSKISSRCKLDVYTNASGRQNALLRLLDSALSLPAGQEVLVYGRESVKWRTPKNSADYLSLLRRKQLTILQKGDKITVLHTMDRGDDELVQNILHWLPMHLTRKTEALYSPEYTDSPIKTSVTILRGKSAMFGLTADGQNSALSTFYSTDPPLVGKAEEYFDALKASSIPLFENDDAEETTNLSLELSARSCNSFQYCVLPFQFCLSRSDFRRLFMENNIEGDALTNCMIFCDLDQKRLFSTLEKRHTHLLLSFPQLEKALVEGTDVSYCNWLTGISLYLSPEMVRLVCRNLCDVLLDTPNLSVALINDFPLQDISNLTMLSKENSAFLVNMASDEVPGPLIIKEPTIVTALYHYMDRIWRSTPKIHREKVNVIQLLQDIL